MTQKSENLRSILDDGPLRIARAIQIVRDIARELAHSHLQGVVHGGIKPANILVLRSGGVKMIEYGAGPAVPLSPEQARGEPSDYRCDIFALGAVFYEMLTQRAPFSGTTPKEVAHSILHTDPAPPSAYNRNVPPALDAMVMSMLAKLPADRTPGVPVVLRDLDRLEEELGLAHPGNDVVADVHVAPAPDVAPAKAGAHVPRREPTLRMPEPHELRDVPEPGFRADARDDDPVEHRKRIIEREVAEHRRAPREPAPWPPRSSRVETFTAVITVLVVLGLGVAGFLYFSTDANWKTVLAKRVEEARAAISSTKPSSLATASTEPVAPAPVAPKALPAEPTPLPQQEIPATARVAARSTVTPPAVEAPKAAPAPAPVATPAPAPVLAEEPETPAKPPSGSGLTLPPSMVATPKKETAPAPAEAEEEEPAPVKPVAKPVAKPAAVAKVDKLEAARKPPVKPAQIVFAVSPGGEIYIDGNFLATTPPATTFEIAPGMYRVEVRNGSRKPYLTYMTVESGDVRRITHDFNAKPSRPPG